MKDFLKKYEEHVFFAIITIAMFVAIGSMSSCIEYAKNKEEAELEEKRKNMTKEEVIIFNAKQKSCNKRTGSRPSCWSDEDWELFFYKYCQKVKCE